jgi:hypothetical protein
MGSYHIEKCIFTGLPAAHYPSGRDSLEYIIEYRKIRTLITLTWKAVDWLANPPSVLEDNRHIFAALILTGQWLPQGVEVDESTLTKILDTKKYPKTRDEKRFGLLYFLSKQPKEDGQFIDLSKTQFYRYEWMKLFFRSRQELTFHAKALHDEGLIDAVFRETGEKLLVGYRMTFDGLTIAESGLYGDLAINNKCFIAMSFSPEMKVSLRPTASCEGW